MTRLKRRRQRATQPKPPNYTPRDLVCQQCMKEKGNDKLTDMPKCNTDKKVAKHNANVAKKNAKSPGWSQKKESSRRVQRAIKKGGY